MKSTKLEERPQRALRINKRELRSLEECMSSSNEAILKRQRSPVISVPGGKSMKSWKDRRFIFFLAIFLWIFFGAPPFSNQEAKAAQISSVQRGTATSTGDGTTTVSISSVDTAKAFLIFSTRHNGDRPVNSEIRGRIATSTSLEFLRVTSTTNLQFRIDGAASTHIIWWQVIEFTNTECQ